MRSKAIEEYKQKLKLSDIQREVLFGILLGDGHLETQNKGKTYRLKVEQSVKHEVYLLHLYNIFQDWVLTKPSFRNVKSKSSNSKNIKFQTLSHSAFRFYAQQFYFDGKKVVPKIINKLLTPCALAYWFMDDGSIKSKESKGLILNTQGFVVKDIEKLICLLRKKFSLECKIRNQKDGHQIYISGKSNELFVKLIDNFLIPEMRYKLNEKTKLPKE